MFTRTTMDRLIGKKPTNMQVLIVFVKCNRMSKPLRQITSIVLLISNTLFWFFAAIFLSFSEFATNANIIVKTLLFIEALLYLICTYGLYKKIKLIYLFSLLLTLGNSILSLTDELDISDFVSFILSLLTFTTLLTLWSDIKTSGKRKSK